MSMSEDAGGGQAAGAEQRVGPETAGEAQKQRRKPRSDKGTKRPGSYMAVRRILDIGDGDGERTVLSILAEGNSSAAVLEAAAQAMEVGETCEVWQRVGKPRTATLKL